MRLNLKQSHKDIIFWVLLASGVGVCIGGVFVPVLMPVGMILLTGAIALSKDITSEPEQDHPGNLPSIPESETQAALSDENVSLNLHFDIIRHRPCPLLPDAEEVKKLAEELAEEHKVSKRLH